MIYEIILETDVDFYYYKVDTLSNNIGLIR